MLPDADGRAVDAVANPLLAAIRERLDAGRVAPGAHPEAGIGPLVTAEHRDRVAAYIDSAAAQGAVVIADVRRHPAYAGPGHLLGPAFVDGATPDMDRYRDEIFGPVPCVVRTPTCDEALALVHHSPWGNATAIFTRGGQPAAAPHGAWRTRWRPAWSASTCRPRGRWVRTRSAAGRTPWSATPASTGPRASACTPARGWSPAAGPTPLRARSAPASRACTPPPARPPQGRRAAAGGLARAEGVHGACRFRSRPRRVRAARGRAVAYLFGLAATASPTAHLHLVAVRFG